MPRNPNDIYYTFDAMPFGPFRPEPMRNRDRILYEIEGRFGSGVRQLVEAAIDETVRETIMLNGRADPQADALRTQLKEYATLFERLKKQAKPFATVMAVTKSGVVLNFKGNTIEAELPPDKKLAPGQTVKLAAETLQVFDVVEGAGTNTGEVVTVTRVVTRCDVAPTCEVDRAGTTRAVAYSGVVEEGDRVVLDPSGTVIVANLGKPETGCEFTASTGVTWDDIGGLEDAKRQMREAIEAPTRHAEMFARYGKGRVRGVLLYGAPGCGKTMLGKAAATAHAEVHGKTDGVAFHYVKGPELLNMYVGNTERGIRELFENARRHRRKHGYPAIIFIDEADAILGKRRDMGFTLSSTVVPMFLAEMDGLEESGALVLLATNRPNTLDPAVVRDGRIDRRIRIKRPDRESAVAIVRKCLRGRPLEMPELDGAKIVASALYDSSLVLYRVKKNSSVGNGVAMTLGHTVSGAMLTGIVDRATSLAIHRELEGGQAGVLEADLIGAVRETFEQARDVNHDDEIAEFTEGWEHQVEKITKESTRAHAHAAGN